MYEILVDIVVSSIGRPLMKIVGDGYFGFYANDNINWQLREDVVVGVDETMTTLKAQGVVFVSDLDIRTHISSSQRKSFQASTGGAAVPSPSPGPPLPSRRRCSHRKLDLVNSVSTPTIENPTPPPSEWLEDTLIDLYLSGYKTENSTADTMTVPLERDDGSADVGDKWIPGPVDANGIVDKTAVDEGMAYSDTYELEEGEWIPDAEDLNQLKWHS
ncbi:uncharacterized protein [Arachis hypogaea]|uniref:uncharacterized protein n=1 Tax=Arachis hypogaea TaxID=3818 RepID=UPI003B22533B